MDPDFVNRHPDFAAGGNLYVDIFIHRMQKVDDIYRDKSVFVRSLKTGQGSAVPFNDCSVTLKVKVEVDGELRFCHNDLEGRELVEDTAFQALYDLEQYSVPACVRKALKVAKVFELVELRIAKSD